MSKSKTKKSPVHTPLDFMLPSTVESIQQGWLISCQSSALISGFFAIISILLFILFKNPSILSTNSKISNRTQTASEILAYASLILNISACASCFILLDRLGDIPYRAARKPNAPKGGQTVMRSNGILKIYGVGALWRWAVWHWLICFLFGFWSIMAQILLFVWTQLENQKAAIAISTLGAFCLLPWIAFILAPLVNGLSGIRSNENDEEANFEPEPASEARPVSRYMSGYRLSTVTQEPFRVSIAPTFPIPQHIQSPTSPTTKQDNQVFK